jgi:hypothetical protein
VLLSDLPKAEERARQVADVIRQAGLGAHAEAGALEAQLSALIARGREADEVVAARRSGSARTSTASRRRPGPRRSACRRQPAPWRQSWTAA